MYVCRRGLGWLILKCHKEISYEKCDLWVSYFIWKNMIWKQEIFCGSVIWFHDYNMRLWVHDTIYSFTSLLFWGFNVHCDSGTTWKLVLIRVWGTQTSKALFKLVEKQMLEFGLDPHCCRRAEQGSSHDENLPDLSLVRLSTWYTSPIASTWWLQMCSTRKLLLL